MLVAMSLLLSMPVEILLYIQSFLYTLDNNFDHYGNKNNILSTRATCRQLAVIGEVAIFEHIKFVPDDEGFRRLSELAKSRLCRHVRMISCHFEIRRVGKSSKSTLLDKETRFQRLLEVAEKGTMGLANILSLFQNLRAINICQNWASSWELDSREAQALTARPVACRLLENVTHALATSTCDITDLTLSSDRAFCPQWPFSIAAFHPYAPETNELYQRAFGNLRRLKVVLPRIARDGVGEYGLNVRGLRALIESSPQLEELYLSIDMSFDYEPFDLDFAVPNLQRLTLDGLLLKDWGLLFTFLLKCRTAIENVEFRRLSFVHDPLILSA